jgi:hypothetical protein
MRRRKFPEEGPIVDPQFAAFLARICEGAEGSKQTKVKIQGFPPQDIPDGIQYQRSMLQDFYTKWKKNKFGPSEESEDAAPTALKMPTPIKIGLANCDKLLSASDNVTSSFSQVSTGFLLFANAYPKHASTCYKLAEFSFKMATIASRILSASWKLTHGFTLSSTETAIGEIDSILNDLTPTFLKVYLQLDNLYSEYVNCVTTEKAFERDVQFQIGYKPPPMESQVSAFVSVAEENLDRVLEISGGMQRIIERLPDPPEQGQVPEQRMEVAESDRPHTLQNVRESVDTLEEDMRAMCRHLSVFRVSGP